MRLAASTAPSISGGPSTRYRLTTPSTIARSISASVTSRSSRSRMIRAQAAELAPITASRSPAVHVRSWAAAKSWRTSSHQISESTRTPSRSKMTHPFRLTIVRPVGREESGRARPRTRGLASRSVASKPPFLGGPRLAHGRRTTFVTFGRCADARTGYGWIMHIRRGFLGWGVFLILAGAIPLAVRAGYITNDDLSRYFSLWPLILVGIGVGLILSRTSFDFVGGLIVAATAGIMVGGLLSAGVSGFSGASCGSNAGTTPFPARDGSFASTGDVEIRLDCGEMTVGVGQGSNWHLEGSDAKGSGPDVNAEPSSLQVQSRHEGRTSWLGFGDRDTWRLTLPATPTLGLDLRLNAGRGTLDLAGAHLADVGLEMNAGSASLDLGNVAAISTIDMRLNAGSLGVTLPSLSLTGSIQANAGAVKICVPPGAAVRLHTGESIIASYDYAGHGLVQDGSTWTTPGFDVAPVKIDLETKANAGSFTLDPEAGCG